MDWIIRSELLGKKYRIRHLKQASYETLRDTLADKAKGWIGKTSSFASTQPTGSSSREDFWALRDVSFEVRPGDRLGIIGRNGAGKTTLLKILSRITEPSTGQVEIRGRLASLLEVGTGFHPELTGRENIFLNGAILGMHRQEIRRKFDEIVAFAEVEQFLDMPVKRYSSGMYVRLAFAVAAHLEPEILIVDEVLAVGDTEFQRKCLGKMEDVSKEGRTVLFVSHNLRAVSNLCQRTLLLEAGTLMADGKTNEVIAGYLDKKLAYLDATNAEIELPEDADKSVQITHVRLLGKNNMPAIRHTLTDPITVEMDFVLRQNFRNLIGTLQVRSMDGEVIFASHEPDWINFKARQKQRVFPKKSGRYHTSVTLPAPMLNSGMYELSLGLVSPASEWLDIVRDLHFEVIDAGSFASCVFNRQRGGWLAIPVNWEVTREKS